MTTPRKAILSAGFGRFASFDPNAQAAFGADAGARVKELLAISVEKANQAGFDITSVDINPQDPEDSLKRFIDELKRREYVGVNIGYGVRGHKGMIDVYMKVSTA